MYTPSHFEQPDIAVMHELIRARPLATLVTSAPDGLNANHIPLHLVSEPAPCGRLQGHVARANPVWREVADGVEALAIFHGPDAYITPSWYASKQDSGKVVPTWNYVVVHAHGRLRVIDDRVWLRKQLAALTAHNEAAFAEPWQISDAPEEFIDKLSAAIVGIELVITRLQGKWKVSQNQPVANQQSVIAGLHSMGTEAATAMSELVASAGKPR